MGTENLAGRFFVLGFDGVDEPSPLLEEIARRFGLGGAILFRRNIQTPEQVRRLTSKVRALEGDHGLMIGVDQEGGRIQRLKPPQFSQFPRPCDVTAETALEVGRKLGAELADLGFNTDFAPVLDIHTNPKNPIIAERSFGSDPEVVCKTAGLFIQGLEEQGVLACGKHFPGHGDTSQDSHLTLPVVDLTEERLRSVEIVPFQRMMARDLKLIMTAHVLYPTLDASLPATFSSRIMTDLLRGELGFEGAAVTDDLGMAGALSHADLPEAAVSAFGAGCDLLMVCDYHERHEEIIAAFDAAVRKSAALQRRAEESSQRIQSLLKFWSRTS